jgi:hypothetical protein
MPGMGTRNQLVWSLVRPRALVAAPHAPSYRRLIGLIEISQNANHQIGRVYLFDLFQRLLWDGVTFHSSASGLNFLLRLPGPDGPGHEPFTAQAT